MLPSIYDCQQGERLDAPRVAVAARLMIPSGTGAWFCPKFRLLPRSEAHELGQSPMLPQGPFPTDILRIQSPMPEVLPHYSKKQVWQRWTVSIPC